MTAVSGTSKYIAVHKNCITDFLKDFDGCVTICEKEGDYYSVDVCVLDKPEEIAKRTEFGDDEGIKDNMKESGL